MSRRDADPVAATIRRPARSSIVEDVDITGAIADYSDIDLTPVRERADWAGRHVVRMKRLVDAYVDSRPFAVYLSKSPDGTRIVEEATLTGDPPYQLGLAFGDVTHHLRAVLDNLVGAVAVGGPTRHSAFPIADNERRFAELAGFMLREVPDWAVAAVRQMQPIAGSEYHDLGVEIRAIEAIAQRDRHRALLIHAPILDQTGPIYYADPTVDSRYPQVEHLYPNPRTTQVRYPIGTLIRLEYRVRVLVAEDIEGVREAEIVRLAERWHAVIGQVIEIMDRALDGAWHRG